MSQRAGYHISDQYATHFVTFTVVGWVDLFTRKACKDILIDSFQYCMTNKGLVVHAFVIMSSHVHIILTANEHSDGPSSIIRDMKKHTAKQLLKWVLKSGKESRKEWLEMALNTMPNTTRITSNTSYGSEISIRKSAFIQDLLIKKSIIYTKILW